LDSIKIKSAEQQKREHVKNFDDFWKGNNIIIIRSPTPPSRRRRRLRYRQNLQSAIIVHNL